MTESPDERQARLIAQAEAEIAEELQHTLQEAIAEAPNTHGEKDHGRLGRIIAILGRFIAPRA